MHSTMKSSHQNIFTTTKKCRSSSHSCGQMVSVIGILVICLSSSIPWVAAVTNCTLVNRVFKTMQHNQAFDVRADGWPMDDVKLRHCDVPANSSTCCSTYIESQLVVAGRVSLERSYKESINKLASILGTRANRFEDFFKDLLTASRKGFHDMFRRTYGVIYEQNSYVFSDLFNELEKYYSRGKVDLAETMDLFFNKLYQKMFTVLNSQYIFDDKYLGCVGENMKNLKPFGDVPEKLSVQIKRSFVATRTFAQSLSAASEVLKNMAKIRMSSDCQSVQTKMQQCSLCHGYMVKPCEHYCIQSVKKCLSFLTDMDSEWNNFVSNMEKISERLLGPFNIVVVVKPIDIKISEAVMNFQEKGEDITRQVFQGCGKPVLGKRRRRSVEYAEDVDDESSESEIRTKRPVDQVNRELQYEPLDFSSNQHNGGVNKGRRKNKKKQMLSMKENADDDDVNKDPLHDVLVKDIRQRVKESREFWDLLPYQVCNGEEYTTLTSKVDLCWNGKTIGKFNADIIKDGKDDIPAVGVTPHQTSIVQQQLFQLRTVNNQLKNAFQGMDVEWTDTEEVFYGSGSGSGEGNYDDDFDSSGDGSVTGHNDLPNFIDDTKDPKVAVDNASSTVQGVNGAGGSGGNYGGKSTAVDGNAATPNSPMSVRRALITYLFPIFMAWFGGIFSDLL